MREVPETVGPAERPETRVPCKHELVIDNFNHNSPLAMPLLGHATPVIRQSLARTAVKVKTPARFSHDHHGPEETVPFNFRSRLFGAKVVVYLATGFGLPFFAAWYQLKKAGGSA